MDNNGLSLEGSASTAVVLTEVIALIDKDKPTGVPLRNIRIAAPEKSWKAYVTDDGSVKLSGVIPSSESQKAIAQSARQKFSNFAIEDNTTVNPKLNARWTQAALRSLELLLLLDNGYVEVTEKSIHLKGAAPSETAVQSIDAIASNLPSGFALKSEVTAPAPHHGMAANPYTSSAIIRR
jgi:hypothetical protein